MAVISGVVYFENDDLFFQSIDCTERERERERERRERERGERERERELELELENFIFQGL